MAKRISESFGMGAKKVFREYKRILVSLTETYAYWEWFKPGGFINFFNHIGHSPKGGQYVISKNDDSKGWEPGNCYWKLIREYGRYKKKRHPNRYVTQNNCIIKWKMDEKFVPDLNKGGVYRITFNNNKFYIGSTSNFKKRIMTYKSGFNGVAAIHNKGILKCVLECSSIRFEILELINDKEERQRTEGLYIKRNLESELLLNRAHDPKSNKGIRWTKEERDALSQKFKDGYGHTFWLHRKVNVQKVYNWSFNRKR